MGWVVVGGWWAMPGGSLAEGVSVDERLERVEQKTLSESPGAEQETGNMVFFRGGWAGLIHDRSNQVETGAFGLSGTNDNNNGYYVGAILTEYESDWEWHSLY